MVLVDIKVGSDVMKERALRIFSHLTDEVDAILLMNAEEPNSDAAFFYATGAASGLFEECPAIIWPDGRVQLITSRLEETSARRTEAEVLVFSTGAEKTAILKDLLKGVKKLGFNGSGMMYNSLKQVERAVPDLVLMDIGKAISAARMVKDEKEIGAIREACRIASRVGDEIPDFLRVGMKEFEAAAEIGYRMQKRGATSVSFETIAAFGPASAEPHYSPGESELVPGQAALFDFGCKYNKYCSDVTRTFFFGSASARQKRMYEVVLEAQRRGLEAIRAGVKAVDVDAAARNYIDSTEFKGRFIHSLGHGLGLAVHDGGRFAPGVDIVLKENMIMTVEPGVYVPGEGGVRIEDDVRITRDGYEMLTDASKELRVV